MFRRTLGAIHSSTTPLFALVVKEKRNILTPEEIAAAFREITEKFGPIINPKQLAEILHVGRSTVYQWIQQGRLDGAFRKRGKHVLIWRDRAISILFNGPEWRKDHDEEESEH